MEERNMVLIVRGKSIDPDVENLLKRLSTELPKLDYVTLKHGPRLLESLQNISPHLILFHLSDGIEHPTQTLERLKKLFRGAPIFGLIDNSSYEIEREALLLGINAVFTKESDTESLILNVLAVLQRAD